MIFIKKPILVTGIHRSGTTFTGKMLSLNKNIGYIFEPFNPEYGLKYFDKYFKYLTENNMTKLDYKIINNLINLKEAKYNKLKIYEQDSGIKKIIKIMFRLLFKSKNNLKYRYIKYNPIIDRLLIKDPIACLSSEFLHNYFDMEVLVLVRHPLSFIGSIKKLNWDFNFDNFIIQKDLMNEQLFSFKNEIEEMNNNNVDIVKKGVLLWNCIYYVLYNYIKRNPQFLVIKHEKLSTEPIVTFKYLYEKLNLNFDQEVVKKINNYTNEKNKIEPNNNKAHNLKRNSKSIINSWKYRLNNDEIEYIIKNTKEISGKLYDKPPEKIFNL